MKNSTTLIAIFLLALCFNACQETTPSERADLILLNGNVFTAEADRFAVQAIAIKEDRILQVGSNEDVKALANESTQTIDLKGEFVMPGIVEGHAHFSGLGKSLMNLNFMKAKNWSEIVSMVEARVKEAKPGEWIIGRGWHQEKWDTPLDRQVLGYPYHDDLSAISPDNPVMLTHASGHSLFANQQAMELAGVTMETPSPVGGEIVRDSRGNAIGVFEETAEGIVESAYQKYLATLSEEAKLDIWYKQIELAAQNCLENGITSFQDAGASFAEIERYKKLAEAGELDVRLWSMISGSQEDLAAKAPNFPLLNVGNHHFSVRSIKAYMDGALGSFGAWLLRSYEDKPEFVGQNVTPIEKIKEVADVAMANDLQLCIHAIGDKGNRMVLNLYEQAFSEHPQKKDLRWRIEHAQHLDTVDIPRFKELGVIASMQGIHCTSDAPFVVKRLGESRAKYGAYPWRSLLDAGAVVINGTDAPVEDINPIESFYASVTRRRTNPNMVFFPEQSMTRQEALLSYTLSAAYAGHEEDMKGSLKAGKLADITVLSKDLLNCTDDEILDTKVLMTMVGGQVKYKQSF